MNNIKKIGLTALGTSLIATSAYAGALSGSGGGLESDNCGIKRVIAETSSSSTFSIS